MICCHQTGNDHIHGKTEGHIFTDWQTLQTAFGIVSFQIMFRKPRVSNLRSVAFDVMVCWETVLVLTLVYLDVIMENKAVGTHIHNVMIMNMITSLFFVSYGHVSKS